MSRTALLVASMETEHPEYLNIATQDRLHQPYRQTIFPQMKVIFCRCSGGGSVRRIPCRGAGAPSWPSHVIEP